MYILKDNIWQWNSQPHQLKQQLKHIDFNKNIYLHTDNSLSILYVQVSNEYDIQKIDCSFKYGNYMIFFCRNSFYMSKIDLINDIYFLKKSCYGNSMCNYCCKNQKRHIVASSCDQCYDHVKHLWYTYIHIYFNITQLKHFIMNDVIDTIIYHYILCLGYTVTHPKISQIRTKLS